MGGRIDSADVFGRDLGERLDEHYEGLALVSLVIPSKHELSLNFGMESLLGNPVLLPTFLGNVLRLRRAPFQGRLRDGRIQLLGVHLVRYVLWMWR